MAGAQPEQDIPALNQQVTELREQGKYAQALDLARHTCELTQSALGDDHLETARSISNLGGLLLDMGHFAEAKPYLARALENRRRLLGEQHPDTATSLGNLGSLLWRTGDLAAARRHYEQALEIHRSVLPNDHSTIATSLNNLGMLLRYTGDLEGARPYLEEALTIRLRVLGELHADTVTSIGNLGGMLRRKGELAAARLYFERALAIRIRLLGNDHPDTARSLSNLGELLRDMGDLPGARPYFVQALDIRRRALSDCHPSTASSLNNLGNLLRDQGDLAASRPLLEQALEIHRTLQGDRHLQTAKSLYNLATLEVASWRIGEALTLIRQAWVIEDRLIGQVFSIGSDHQRLLFLGKLQDNQNRFLSLVYGHLSQSPEAIRAAFALVLRRKALAAEALAAQRDAILGGRYPHLRESFDQLTQLRRIIAQKMLAGPASGETLTAHEQILDQWRQHQQQRETALTQQIPELTLEPHLRNADRRAVALSLPEGVALVEFVRFDVFDFHAVPARGENRWQPARYLAFVLPAGQPEQVQMIDLGEAGPIDQLIADFRASVTVGPQDRPDRDVRRQRPDSPPAVQAQAGPALRAAVFDKLLPALGACNRLLLAPDSDLTRLPFEVLPAADGRLLLEQYRISYISCGRDVLRFSAASPGRPAEPLVLADPLFDLAAGENRHVFNVPAQGRCSRDIRHSGYHFRRLPGTRAEGEQVAALLGVGPWLESDALEGRLKQVRSPRILHLATHGFFLADQPHDPSRDLHDPTWDTAQPGSFGRLSGALPENPMLRAGLALAGAQSWLDGAALPTEAEDGLLTAEDVTGLDLLDTQLVVLSACETGLGEVRTGEGVLGLCRAFIVAGARTLVVSLWKVPDQHTQELMIDFYRRVLAGQAVADALREAQLSMKQKYPDPYFWGAFVCQGNPGPLAAAR
jgi:CHAT domain-containing protein/tetratricopeptide (TPR) repeat protein